MAGQFKPSRDPRNSDVDALGDSRRQGYFAGRKRVFHAVPAEEVAGWLESGPGGLSGDEADRRLARMGPNELARNPPPSRWRLFFGQFRSAVVWLLIAAALISGALGEWIDTAAILAIVLAQRHAGLLAGRQVAAGPGSARRPGRSAGPRGARRTTAKHRGQRAGARRSPPPRSRRPHRGRRAGCSIRSGSRCKRRP